MRRTLPALAVAVTLLLPTVALADTIRLGAGIGPWKIGMPFKKTRGLLRTERYPGRAGPGCTLGPATATRIDYYAGFRVSWQNGRLTDVATTRAGDRSPKGFAIRVSRFQAVRRANPKARVSQRRDRYNLGRTSLTVIRKTGYETWKSFTYWFDEGGLLLALQTGEGGC